MIIVRIKGGLGNQLFQYAAGYALAQRLQQPLRFNAAFTSNMTQRGYKLPFLNVESDGTIQDAELPDEVNIVKNKYINKALRIVGVSKIGFPNGLYWLEAQEKFLPEFFTIQADTLYVDGYFQSPKYFDIHREKLLKAITPNYDEEQACLRELNEIRINTSIAVHVRRSDFKKDNNKFHYLLDEKYYCRAVRYMREHVQNPTFFWFSDDMNWVKENIGNADDFRFVNIKTNHGDVDDMMLMKNCNHIITANSTFSWWAAWLNEHEDAIRVVPARQYGQSEMIPDTWIKR